MKKYPALPMHHLNKKNLESLYRAYNRREFIHPDPLEFLHHYDDPGDREIVGLIASSLAYGKVSQILKSVKTVTSVLGPSPRSCLLNRGPGKISALLRGFRHRFTDEHDMALLILGIRRLLLRYGSLCQCFRKGYRDNDEDVMNALIFFVRELTGAGEFKNSMLLPDPRKKSACKRLNLYLRWMVRKDAVDPGGWDGIPASKLIIPLDTHMHRFGLIFGFTGRKNGDLATAREITGGFRRLSPDDPVRYDFSITRFGIRKELTFENLGVLLKNGRQGSSDRVSG